MKHEDKKIITDKFCIHVKETEPCCNCFWCCITDWRANRRTTEQSRRSSWTVRDWIIQLEGRRRTAERENIAHPCMYKNNKCIGDDTKDAARRSQTAFSKQNNTFYGTPMSVTLSQVCEKLQNFTEIRRNRSFDCWVMAENDF